MFDSAAGVKGGPGLDPSSEFDILLTLTVIHLTKLNGRVLILNGLITKARRVSHILVADSKPQPQFSSTGTTWIQTPEIKRQHTGLHMKNSDSDA